MQRRHDLDALRVIAFAFLILYHLAMAYVADWGCRLVRAVPNLAVAGAVDT